MKLNEDNEVKIIGIIVEHPTEVRYLLYKLIGKVLAFFPKDATSDFLFLYPSSSRIPLIN